MSRRSAARQVLRRSNLADLPAPLRVRYAERMLIKKYGNRRLYDTEASRYITLEELSARIRDGDDVEVVDAKTGQDLTQGTLAQIILESRGAAKLLPVPLLKQLVRMGDDALAEFFGRYMAWSLEIYVHMRHGTQSFMPWNPLARLFSGVMPWSEPPRSPPPPARQTPQKSTQDELSDLRQEIAELKRAVGKKPRK